MREPVLDTPGERLKWARKRGGYDEAATFASALGLNEKTYRAYENDQNGFAKHSPWFAERLGVPTDWLLAGGDLPSGDAPAPKAWEVRGAPRDLLDRMNLEQVREVQVEFAMGGGSIVENNPVLSWRAFDRDWLRSVTRAKADDLFFARGVGDSMQPTLHDDDSMLINRAENRIDRQDRIWAIAYGDLGMVKRIRKLPGGKYLVLSDNSTVQPFEAADGEMTVIGRVVWIGRKM
jgi:phage repressor protein C with HTH and peptisase S24 domain